MLVAINCVTIGFIIRRLRKLRSKMSERTFRMHKQLIVALILAVSYNWMIIAYVLYTVRHSIELSIALLYRTVRSRVPAVRIVSE